MILNADQKKTRKEFCQNYIDSDYSQKIFIDECVLKEEQKNAESGDQMKKITVYHLLNWNAK